MTSRKTLTILCGGKSAEHEISIISASNVLLALNPNHYHIQVIYITEKGEWRYLLDWKKAATEIEPKKWAEIKEFEHVTPWCGHPEGQWLVTDAFPKCYRTDVVFPVMHGEHGEDGDMQGLLEILGVPYVGSGVMSSAICMDKVINKQLMQQAHIPVVDYRFCYAHEIARFDFEALIREWNFPFFIKPANTGSSVGVFKVYDHAQLKTAIEKAQKYDAKLIFEKFTPVREIECAVLGNENPKSSIAGELIIHHDFYDYDAKYIDPNGAELKIPALLSEEQMKTAQDLAVKAYLAMNCKGLARVDLFLTQDGKFFVNELNTLPGFTKISMYPKLWEYSGIAYSDLLDQLIALAMQ